MKTIALVAFDQLTDIDLFLMWDILGRNTEDWHVRILGSSPIVRSAHGLPVSVHGPLSEANSADAVLFVSGKEGIPAALAAPDFLPSFELDPRRQRIGSICAGAFILERLISRTRLANSKTLYVADLALHHRREKMALPMPVQGCALCFGQPVQDLDRCH